MVTPNLEQNQRERYHRPAKATTCPVSNGFGMLYGAFTCCVAAGERSQRIVQPHFIRLLANPSIHHHPQPRILSTIPSNRVGIDFLQVRLAYGQKIGPRLATQILHTRIDDRRCRETHAQSEQAHIELPDPLWFAPHRFGSSICWYRLATNKQSAYGDANHRQDNREDNQKPEWNLGLLTVSI